MNKLRQGRMADAIKRALADAASAQRGFLEPETQVTVTGILMGASVASRIAISEV